MPEQPVANPPDTELVDLLVVAYRDFNARRMEAVLAIMQPDVDWPNGLEGGRVPGRDNVRVYWKRQWSIVDPFLDPVEFKTTPDGKIDVKIHQFVRDLEGNLIRESYVHHVYTFRDGLIDHMEIL